jgi:hypothetical protein
MQIDVLAAIAVTLGNKFTVTVTVAVFTQLFASVPVTVYVVVVVGDTCSMADVPPELHT